MANNAARVGKREVRKALELHGGVVMHVAASFNVSRQTVYNWIAKYQLHDLVRQTRYVMHDIAEDNIYRAAIAGNLDVSMFILRYMPPGAHQERWTSRSELTGKDGAPLGLSADVVRLLEAMGIPLDDVARQFEQMIREEAAAQQSAAAQQKAASER